MSVEIVPCSACKKSVFWVVVSKSRKRMPLDAEPDDELGNVCYVWGVDRSTSTKLAHVCGASERELFIGKQMLYVSHFASCPKAAALRKSRRKSGARR